MYRTLVQKLGKVRPCTIEYSKGKARCYQAKLSLVIVMLGKVELWLSGIEYSVVIV